MADSYHALSSRSMRLHLALRDTCAYPPWLSVTRPYYPTSYIEGLGLIGLVR